MHEVSIVIPCHGRSDLLVKTLTSVRAQTYRPLQVIVVDDASSPPISIEGESSHEMRVELIRSGVQSGPGAARELGRCAARGGYIAYLDSDDLWHPQKIEAQVSALKDAPGAGMCYCTSREFRDDHDLNSGKIRKNSSLAIPEFLPGVLYGRPWDTSACLWTRDAVDRIGPWFNGWCWEDYEYEVRAGLANIRIAHVPRVLCYYRRGHVDGQLSKDPVSRDALRRKAFTQVRIAEIILDEKRACSSEVMARTAFLLCHTAKDLIAFGDGEGASTCLRWASRCAGPVRGAPAYTLSILAGRIVDGRAGWRLRRWIGRAGRIACLARTVSYKRLSGESQACA